MSLRATILVAAWLTFASNANGDVESWADPKLTVREGLELWLDAGRAAGDQPLKEADAVDKWLDASGGSRNLQQNETKSRPTVLKIGEQALVSFDGIDDCLRLAGQAAELRSFTVVLVAAPRVNLGAFSGFLALSKANERDYSSGLNIDLGPWATAKFSALNVEGRGFTGAQSLRNRESPLGRLETVMVTSEEGQGTVRLFVDGKPEGQRPREGSAISMDEITVGARHYSNDAGPQRPAGFFRGEIAEVLIFSRALTDDEISTLENYLDAKYAGLNDALPAEVDGRSQPLVMVPDPPPVQMLLPGFSVHELPVELSNINNVKYRADGTLVALAYDGKVWLLSDTNNDGLEDKAEEFWDNPDGLRAPIGMDLTPPSYKHGDGLFLVGKTRCLLVVDTDGDRRADKVIDLADRWRESFHAVDGLGIVFDKSDGSVYYGRGTYNFSDPLLRDKEGNSKYSLTDESGAVIRVAPDLKTREVVATGIRFPVALRINARGDLFATDQEGATWVPNGNPFDELLHIQRGRHYGFPPRHPKYVPNVIDEPSTFDFGPQHQCTCGFNFNEPLAEVAPVFGPAWWKGDAIVAGYSRGKLYRTKLSKTGADYVASNQLIGCLAMMPVDACIGPRGELVVACHSGGPDWGSGPTGKGKLFKISYTDAEHPQPVFAWPTGPREIRVEFDRPVDANQLRDLVAKSSLTAGRFVRAGDRFESFFPGYAAVQAQKLAPRIDVPLRSAQLSPDRRAILLATDSIAHAAHYALTLPGMGRPAADAMPDKSLPQHPAIDLDFDLSGCEATWTPADGGPEWTGWLPHFDLHVSKKFTAGSATHDALWSAMQWPGKLTLRTQLDLTDMLRPAVQPGSKIDYEYPPEAVTVKFATPSPATRLKLSTPTAEASATPDGTSASFTVPATVDKRVAVEIQLTSAAESPLLAASWTTNEDNRPRPFPLRRIFMPWADLRTESFEPAPLAKAPELEGGSWARGSKEYFGQEAACSKCHAMHGRGGNIGPDLSNLIHRDYASVLRDVNNPSYAINPDHLTYTVILNDGQVLSGVVHTSGNEVSIGDTDGKSVVVDRSAIESMEPSPISTMPEGLTKKLGTERMRDLMTFLLTPPPQMPRDVPGPPLPPPRSAAEVNAVLAGAPEPAAPTRKIGILLVAGVKDHGPGEHDYPAWQKAWAELLAAADDVEIAQAWEWPAKEQFEKADVVVFYQHGDWNDQRAADIDAFLARGGGLVYIHWAVDGRQHGADFARRIGLAAGAPIAFRHGDLELMFDRTQNHPIARNFGLLRLHDESYWRLTGSVPKGLLATSTEDGQPQPQLWALEPQGGRVFVSIPGHYAASFDDPLFRILLLRGIAWTAREPVDRFNDLVWPGANVAK